MQNINYKQIFARKKNNEQKILNICPNVPKESGIYLFYRISEQGFKNCYVGQATTNLLQRMASHLEGYDTHIDKSLRKYGLYDAIKNPFGYKCKVLCLCPKEECDDKEIYYIKKFADEGWQLKNSTGGSQGSGKFGIDENKSGKGYFQGIAQGIKKTKQKVKLYFDKYLDYSIKGKTNKIKERKLVEFGEFISTDNEGGDDNGVQTT